MPIKEEIFGPEIREGFKKSGIFQQVGEYFPSLEKIYKKAFDILLRMVQFIQKINKIIFHYVGASPQLGFSVDPTDFLLDNWIIHKYFGPIRRNI